MHGQTFPASCSPIPTQILVLVTTGSNAISSVPSKSASEPNMNTNRT